jgi:hypothetical protein
LTFRKTFELELLSKGGTVKIMGTLGVECILCCEMDMYLWELGVDYVIWILNVPQKVICLRLCS